MIQILLVILFIRLGSPTDNEHLPLETVEAAISSRCKLRELYDKFRYDHGLIRCRKEHPHRHTIFKKSLEKIRKLKRSDDITWTAGLTPLSDLTEAEIESNYMGYNVTLRERNMNLQARPNGPPSLKIKKLPLEWDWRQAYNQGTYSESFNFVTPIQNQDEPSCWARAAVVPLEARMKKQFMYNGPPQALSVFELYDCTYDGDNGYDDRGGGGSSIDAYKWLHISGRLSSREAIPDRPGAKPTHYMKFAYADTPNIFKGFKLTSIKRVENENTMIAAISEQSPVVVVLSMKGLDLPHYKGGSYFSVTCKDGLYHSMAVVGYTQRALIIKNSWGVGWGDKGYLTWERHHFGWNCGMYEDAVYPTLTYSAAKGKKVIK